MKKLLVLLAVVAVTGCGNNSTEVYVRAADSRDAEKLCAPNDGLVGTTSMYTYQRGMREPRHDGYRAVCANGARFTKMDVK